MSYWNDGPFSNSVFVSSCDDIDIEFKISEFGMSNNLSKLFYIEKISK